MSNKDNTTHEHLRIEAASAAELQTTIETHQAEGYELVSVIQDSENTWHAFLKQDIVRCLESQSQTLNEINTGISMLIDNHPNLVTSGRLDDLQEIVSCILQVVETRDKNRS